MRHSSCGRSCAKACATWRSDFYRSCFSILSDNFSALSTTRSCLSRCRGEPLRINIFAVLFHIYFSKSCSSKVKRQGYLKFNMFMGYQSNHDLQTITSFRVEIAVSLAELAGRVSFFTSRFGRTVTKVTRRVALLALAYAGAVLSVRPSCRQDNARDSFFNALR